MYKIEKRDSAIYVKLNDKFYSSVIYSDTFGVFKEYAMNDTSTHKTGDLIRSFGSLILLEKWYDSINEETSIYK